LSREQAVEKRKSGLSGAALFERLRPLCASVEPEAWIKPGALVSRLDELKARFGHDCERVADVGELLTGSDITAYGARATAVFTRWEKEGGGPTLPALIAHAVSHFGLDPDSPAVAAMFMAAVIAELPNNLQYHGNEHYRKVLFHAIRLAATHNELFAGTKRELDHDRIAALLTASCIHDLGHEGGDNLKEGVYTPGFMEQRAFDISRPYLEAAGLNQDLLGQIETITFCTDITFFAGDNSPCIRMKKIYKHYFWEDDREDVSMMMMGKLRRYDGDPNLVQMAMLLHEADVGSSAGLSYEQTIKETINIIEERGLRTAGPKTVLAFLREQLGETLFTESAKQILGPVMATVIQQAEQDILRGRQTFYEE